LTAARNPTVSWDPFDLPRKRHGSTIAERTKGLFMVILEIFQIHSTHLF